MDGVRDPGAIESALARPLNLAGYGAPDAAALAAAYAYGLAKKHGFLDGNKRTAWVVARLFLADNGLSLALTRRMRSGPWKASLPAALTKPRSSTGSTGTSRRRVPRSGPGRDDIPLGPRRLRRNRPWL